MVTLSAVELAEARGWLADCEWGDMVSKDFASPTLVPDTAVVRAVARLYAGGVAGFRRDCAA